MKSEKDAYGQEIWAFFQGEESYEIVERDDGFIASSKGPPSYFAEFRNWPKNQKKAIKFAKGKILDVGAGAGRTSLYLQKKGLDVVAIDNSPLAVKVCKKRGIKKALVLPFERINELKFGDFDTILMFGNNFGLFGGFNNAKIILKKLHKITTPNAIIIAETNDPGGTDSSEHVSYLKFNKKRKRMPGQLRIRIRFKKYIGDWFDYLFVSKKEMKNILKDTGWKIKKFIDSDGSVYIAVIEKG